MPTLKVEGCCDADSGRLTARDVSRIASALAIEPVRFCVRANGTAESPTAFALMPGRTRWELTLRRREVAEGGELCAFALTLPGGRRICSLGELAPEFCARPMPSGGPGPRAPAERARELSEHIAIVQNWNALVEASGVPHPLEFFLDHLLNVCAAGPLP